MSLTPGGRISLIQQSARLLDKMEWEILDLVLRQYHLPTSVRS